MNKAEIVKNGNVNIESLGINQKSSETDTYRVEVVCLNCGETANASIKMGALVSHYVTATPCSNCGCKQLVRK